MKKFISFLQFDVLFQLILLIGTVVAAFTIFGLAITIPLLFIWQMISCAVGYQYLKDKQRKRYFVTCIVVIILIGITLYFNLLKDNIVLLIVLLIVLPISMAGYYFRLSKDTLNTIEQEFTNQPTTQEDLLDDELVKNRKS